MQQQNKLPTLPFHLILSLSAWISSTIASACLKNASANWASAAQDAFAPLLKDLPHSVSAEAKAQAEQLFHGISLYQATPYTRTLKDAPVIFRHDAARLLDYSADSGQWTVDKKKQPLVHCPLPTVLFIPSLINRYYILDLEQRRSFVRYAAENGVQAVLLDWGEPGAQESGYDCADYVQQVLAACVKFLAETSGGPVVLAGYCMGGLLALAHAQLKPREVAAVGLFATPWDFHAPDVTTPRLDGPTLQTLESWIAQQEPLPAECIQTLFYMSDLWLFQQKFQRFAQLTPGSAAFRDFIALEHWVNDGVPLAGGVARDCLIDWAQRNTLMQGQWRVGGKVIDPGRLDIPVFAAVPAHDHIVPPGCAMALVKRLKQVTLVEPGAGHVGMMVGSRARKELWEPFVEWLGELGERG